MKKVRCSMKFADGREMPYEVVLSKVVGKIRVASRDGSSLRLNAEEVRALDWCVIRDDGGVENVEQFREGSFEELGNG
jgi:hypothetical protein